MDVSFSGRVIEWRGPAPYYFVPLPADECEDVRSLAAVASYGWGVIPVRVQIGDTGFETSLFPKDGGYLLPLKDAVRKPHRLGEGDEVEVAMSVRVDV